MICNSNSISHLIISKRNGANVNENGRGVANSATGSSKSLFTDTFIDRLLEISDQIWRGIMSDYLEHCHIQILK